ncbi:capsid assembly scaffolding protein Gp46 family protein [Streptomyces decoyicus]
MRRPALHHPHPATTGWSHPYAPNPFTFYADGGDDPVTPPAAEPPKPTPPAGKVFTQDDVNALAAKEKSQGERAGARKALEDFAAANGFSSADDAKAFIEAARQAKEAALSEEEKRKAALDKREQELAAKEAAAVARERTATRRSVLVGLGATGDDLDDATALLRVDADADDEALQEAAEALKARRPELFGATRQAPDPSAAPAAPTGLPAGGMPRPGSSQPKPGERGLEMLRRRGKLPAA